MAPPTPRPPATADASLSGRNTCNTAKSTALATTRQQPSRATTTQAATCRGHPSQIPGGPQRGGGVLCGCRRSSFLRPPIRLQRIIEGLRQKAQPPPPSSQLGLPRKAPG